MLSLVLVFALLHPLRQWIDERMSVKLRSVLIQLMIVLCGVFVLVEIIEASLLSAMSHSFPHPPVTVKMRGVKEDFSISRIVSPYFYFFSFSCCLKREDRVLLA